jgi:leucine-rich repeat protein SHOC2
MKPLAWSLLSALALSGCSPSDQFWKKPETGTRVTTIAEALKTPDTVRNLDLFARRLPAFPPEILRLPHLERLSLRTCTVGELPPALATLPQLNWLDLGQTALTNLPAASLQLPNLTYLWLNDNGLSELPASVGSLSKLRYLNLDRNRLTTLPESLGALGELKWLRLNNNPLKALPVNLDGLARNLQRLYLKNTPLPEAERARIRHALPNCQIFF